MKSGTKQECLLLVLLFNIVLDVLAIAIKQGGKRHIDQKQRHKTLSADDMIVRNLYNNSQNQLNIVRS